MQEMRVWSLGQENPLEEEMATHSSILAWEIPGTEEPEGLQPIGSQRVRRNWATEHALRHATGGAVFLVEAPAAAARGFPRSSGHHPVPAAAAKLLQSSPTLCNPIDGSPPGCPVPGILQARTLAWVAIASSNAWKWKVKVKLLSRVRLLATP